MQSHQQTQEHNQQRMIGGTSKKIAAAALGAVLVTGVGLAAIPAGAQSDPTTTTSTTSPAITSGDAGAKTPAALRRRLRARKALMGKELATQLGIPVETLKAAVKTVRDERPDGGFDSPQARRQWIQEHLAAALHIDVATLRAAEVRAADARIDAAVTKGRISEARAQKMKDRIAARLGN